MSETIDLSNNGLVIFDSYCVLCSSLVRLLIKLDRKNKLYFTTFDSKVWSDFNVSFPTTIDSIVYFYKGEYYIQSEAVLKIIQTLSYPWKALQLMRIIPFRIREKLYEYIARNRYKIFGKRNKCFIPSPDIRHRYLK